MTPLSHKAPRDALLLAALALAGVCIAPNAQAQPGFAIHFTEAGGPSIYEHICQGCHMPDAKGAVGAGAYPALAANIRLKNAAYPVLVLINGQRAMPSFGTLSDEQIASVVSYIRTSFGNRYNKPVTAADVKALRPPAP